MYKEMHMCIFFIFTCNGVHINAALWFRLLPPPAEEELSAEFSETFKKS